MLASPQWAADHLSDPNVRFVEVGFSPAAYDSDRLPGDVYWNWDGDILQAGSRDILDRTAVEALLSRSGIGNQTTIVVYDGL